MAGGADFAVIAARQAARKRMRFILTVIGIAIGVAAVIGVVSLGEGIRHQSLTMIKEQSDLTLLEVTGDVRSGTAIPLTASKVSAIMEIPHVAAVAAVSREAFAAPRQTHIGAAGVVWEEFDAVFSPAFQQGGPYASGTAEVVLGSALAETLRRYEGIRTGDRFTARIRQYDAAGMPADSTVELAVAGVLEARDDAFDRLMLVDAGTLASLTAEGAPFAAVYVRVDDSEHVAGVAGAIRSLGLAPHGAFEQIAAVNSLMDILVLVLSLFTGISLIVGGLMIVTTMIISVFERTREIGITMALGASPNDVLRLILFECAYIGAAGGILGCILGIAFAWTINTVGKALIASRLGGAFSVFLSGDITLVTPGVLLFGFAIAVGLSLLAGVYPARKAAHLDPVEAIRHA